MTKLDPTNLADWENHREEYAADMDSFLKDMDEKEIDKASIEVVINAVNNSDSGKSKPIVRRRKGATPRQAPAKSQKVAKVDIIAELNDKEKQDALKFFKEHIATTDVYNIGKAKKQKIEDFFKEQFIETADVFNFLDGDKLKIDLAWNLVAGEIPARIKELEGEALAGKEKKEWTLDEVYAKLTAAGAQDKDVDYFFNLHKKDRLDFLNSSDEDLAIRIEKLRERREADEIRNLGSEKLEEELNDKAAREQKLIFLGDKLRNSRLLYLKKEYDVNKISAKMKRFFNGIKNLSLGNVEEEVKILKDEYRQSVVAFSDAIVDIEGIADKEEQEIMLNYFGVKEALNLQEDKLIIKNGNDPKLLQLTEDVFSDVLKGYLNVYKSSTSYLSKKGAELVGQKTDSKLLKFAGGLSGGMAFSIGLSNIFKTTGAPYWVTKSILLATSTAAMTMENKENMDKELSEQEIKDIEERKLAALEEMETKIQDELAQAMKNIFASEANTSLDYQENKEAINKKMWRSAFLKAAGKNLFFYSAGLGASELIKDFAGFLVDLKNDIFEETKVNKNIPTIAEVDPKTIIEDKREDIPAVEQVNSGSGAAEKGLNPAAISGSSLHSQASIAGTGVKTESIEETMDRSGIESDKVANRETTSSYDNSESRADMLKESEPSESEPKAAEITESIRGEKIIGIELDDYGTGKINVIAGKGIKDTLVKLLMENSEKFTEGKMGWDADKYTSVEEWANKRAIGIVGELKAQYPDYNFDKVSAESSIKIDLSNKADIKIVGFNDPYRLGGDSAIANDLEKTTVKTDLNSENEISEQKEADFEKAVIAEAEKMTNNEMLVAYVTGVSSEEYAKINNLTVAEFLLDDKNESTRELRNIIAAIEAKEDDPTNTVSGALRGINDSDMAALLENKDLTEFDYSDYLGDIVLEELKGQLNLLVILNGIRDEKIDVDNAVFKSFKEAVENTLKPAVKFEDNSTVGKYMVKSIIKAYEMGKIDDFRVALSHIKL